MATDIIKGAFPEFAGLLSTPRESLMAAPIQAARARGETPMQAITGEIQGAGAQLQQSVGGLFGQVPAQVAQQDKLRSIVQSVQAQGADLATPEGMEALAAEFNKFPEFAGMAIAMRQQAQKMRDEKQKMGLEAQLKQSQILENLAQARKAGQPAEPTKVGVSEDGQTVYLQGGVQFTIDINGNRIPFGGRIREGKGTTVALTIPQEADLIRQSQTATSDITKRTSSLNRALTLNAQNSPFAGAAFKQEVASVFGDAQKAATEIAALANTGALDTRIANRVASFVEGKTTEITKDDRDAVLKVLRNQSKDEYERTVAPYRAAVKDDAQARRLFPSFEERYGMPAGRKQRIPIPANKRANFVEGKRYEKNGKMYIVQDGQLVEE